MSIQVLYTGDAIVRGARHGHARSSDGKLNVQLSTPRQMSGDDGPGTNPEQLFAAAWGACFGGAMEYIARQHGIDVSAAQITTRISIGPSSSGTFGLAAEMIITLPSLSQAEAEQFVRAADKACPYSNAVRGNVECRTIVEGAK